MSEKPPAPGTTPNPPAPEPPSPDLAASLAGVVDAALGVGVSLARAVAEATALGKPMAPLPSGTPAVQAIVRYSVAALGNLAQAVMSGAQGVPGVPGARRAAPAGAARATAPGATPGATHGTTAGAARTGAPRVQAGAVLRVPLSVENPGDRPMPGLRPAVRRVCAAGDADASLQLPASAVTFSPPLFDVAPHDFEKLVVQIAVPADLPPGDYGLILALGDDEPDLPMHFTVLPATP